jgi:nitroreductase
MIALNPQTDIKNLKAPEGPEHGASRAQKSSAALATQNLLAALNWRYAVKQYDPARKIDEATWDALEEALTLTPSGIGLQPWKFLVVDDPAVRARLREASYGQPQITEAARLVVFASRVGYSEADVDRFIARVAEVRKQPLEALAGLKAAALSVVARPESDRDIWASRQAYIALGNFLTAAATLGVDATPMEGLEPARYDEILGLKEKGYHTLAVAAAGYRSTGDKYGSLAKVRFERSEVVEHV